MNPPTHRRLTQITCADAEELRSAILAALRPVAEAYGIKIELARELFVRAVNCHVRLECSVRNPAGEALNSEALAYGEHQNRHRLPLDWLFQSFETTDGQVMTLIGYDPEQRRHPFVIRNAQGEVFATPVEVLREGLGRPGRKATDAGASEALPPQILDNGFRPD